MTPPSGRSASVPACSRCGGAGFYFDSDGRPCPCRGSAPVADAPMTLISSGRVVVMHMKMWHGGWAWAVTVDGVLGSPPVAAGWCETQQEAQREGERAVLGWQAVVVS